MGIGIKEAETIKQIERLYTEYKDDVYRYLLSLTRDPTLSEDLLSETFIRAICGIAGFQGRSGVKTWLFGIARNVWLQHLRSQRQTVAYDSLPELCSEENIEDTFAARQAFLRARALLAEKDERTQTILKMREAGAGYAEISKVAGISENSARVIDFRTRKWIKTILLKEGLM